MRKKTMIVKIILISLILLIFQEYCYSIAQAHQTNSSNKTRKHSKEKVSWAENIKVSDTRSKYKRNLKNTSPVHSSKIHSSKSELQKLMPVYVITGVKVSEVYGPELSKAHQIRKHRQIPDKNNSDVYSNLMNQENVIDKFFNISYSKDSLRNEKQEDSSRKFSNVTEINQDIKYSAISHSTTTTRPPTRERIYSEAGFKKSRQQKSHNIFEKDNENPNFMSIFQGPVSVNFVSKCDRLNATTCWFERNIGDTITLGINISSFKKDNSFNVRWIKVYKRHYEESGVVVKIDPDRLPWNMAWKSGGRELWLSPITDSDTDPNAIAARVFPENTESEQGTLHHRIKQLDFRIDVRPIDVIEDYPGKDITINIGDFLTLPKSREFWIDWILEKFPGHLDPLPSNFVVNQSSLIVKNPEDSQLGVVSCIVYSVKGLAFGKRKFNITKKEDKSTTKSKKRSPIFRTYHQGNNHRNRSIRCTKRSDVTYALSDYMKPISRKKRYQRMTRWLERRNCRNQKKNRCRLHPRWAFLDEDYNEEDSTTTLDPRLMSISKLIELSEQSDGTIDDLIPHEVHYVDAEIILVSDKFKTFPRSPDFEPNCTTDEDCGLGALCVVPQGQRKRIVNREAPKNPHRGYCYCRPEYYGDGKQCTKIPTESHREKRIRRK